MSQFTSSARLDQWLWASRSFKTRSQATSACQSGKVKVNGVNGKASRKVQLGDMVDVLCAGRHRILEVRAFAVKRLSAEAAAELFSDHSPVPEPREPRAAPVAERARGAGRPTKRQRREIDRWNQREE